MTTPLHEGAILHAKYRLEHKLGEGGMGVVFAAWHLRLEQRVAIKFLLPAMVTRLDVVERFLREARAASRIEGEHVARVLDVDVLEDGTPFMVLEYLEGSDLSRVRRQRGTLPAAEAVGYVLEACETLEEAHGLGIVHRDIKPANLFLASRRDGRVRVKVLDFGISKMGAAGPHDGGLTGGEVVMGSADYMSPEQMVSSRDVDARADIWALGVVLYELLTGMMPFKGETLVQIFSVVTTQAPVPPRVYRPDLPPGIEVVILRCLEKDRERRFSSVRELMMALEPFRDGSGGGTVSLSAPLAIPSAAAESAGAKASPSTSSGSAFAARPVSTTAGVTSGTGAIALPMRRSILPALVVGLAVLAGAGGAVFLMVKPTALPAAAQGAPSASALVAPPPAPPPVPTVSAVAEAPPPAEPVPTASAAVVRTGRIKSVPPSAPSVKPPSCNPPYVYNAEGKKQYKPECVP